MSPPLAELLLKQLSILTIWPYQANFKSSDIETLICHALNFKILILSTIATLRNFLLKTTKRLIDIQLIKIVCFNKICTKILM